MGGEKGGREGGYEVRDRRKGNREQERERARERERERERGRERERENDLSHTDLSLESNLASIAYMASALVGFSYRLLSHCPCTNEGV